MQQAMKRERMHLAEAVCCCLRTDPQKIFTGIRRPQSVAPCGMRPTYTMAARRGFAALPPAPEAGWFAALVVPPTLV